MDIDIYTGKPNAFYILVLTSGSGSFPTPIGTICLNMAMLGFVHVGFLDGHGEATVSLPIPNLPSLRNIPLNAQAAILDSYNATGYALTNSAAVQVTPPYGFVSGWNRNTGGHVMRIDMTTGNVLDTVKVGGRPIPVTVQSKSGRYLFAASSSPVNLYLVDYGATPPSVQPLNVASRGSINGLAMTRDGRFLYASAYGYPGGSVSTTWVVDADFLSPKFFTVLGTVKGYPAGHNEAQATKTCPDKRYVCNAVFGFGSGNSQISKVDADPHSPGFNTMIAALRLTGGWAANLAIRPGNNYAYVTLFSLGGKGQVAVVDTGNMTCVDQDPVVPGCQNLGGEIGVPRTPVGNNPLGIDCDEAGKYIYLADTISTASPRVYQAIQVDVAPGSPKFHTVTNVYTLLSKQAYQCGVTPDTSRLIVSYNSSTNATLLDTVSGATIRNYSLGFNAYWCAVK